MDEVDEFILEHFGKKGMKWGVRRNPTTGVRPSAKALNESKFGKAANANVQRSLTRSSNRAKNKASRAKDRQKFDKEIEKARANVESGKVKQEFKAAKAAHAANKAKLGSREARKILNEARNKKYTEVQTSQFAKSGKERAIAIAGAAAFGVAYVALRATLNAHS